MTLEEYFKSPDFVELQDENLRQHAIDAVEKILEETNAVKRHQMYSIPAVIQASGLAGFRELIEKQKEKNSSGENKKFWQKLDQLLSVSNISTASEQSLAKYLHDRLRELGMIQDEDTVSAKGEQRRVRRRNRVMIDEFMERVLGTYFEHFMCHYFFITAQRSER